MESSTTTTATPPAAGASKRQRKAALPLGDLTNLLPSTPAPRNPSTRRAVPPAPSDASACSSSTASATPVSKTSSAAAVEEFSSVKSPISTVYTSRKTQGRRNPASVKAPIRTGAAASCPPLGKAARASSHLTKKALTTKHSRPVSSSAPCHPAKKKRHMTMEKSSSGRPKLPDDFVEKQRTYFHLIDAFELPEEEASDTD